MAYSTTADVEAYLGTTFTTTSTPTIAQVTDFITMSDSYIDNFVGHSYATTSVADLIVTVSEPSNIVYLEPKYRPLVSVATLQVNDGTDYDTDYVTKTEGTDFLIADLDTSRLEFKNAVGGKTKAIKIGTLIYGYDEVPSIVKDLSVRLSANKILQTKLGKNSYSSTKRISVGPISISNDTSYSLSFVKQMNSDIDLMLKQLKSNNSYAY